MTSYALVALLANMINNAESIRHRVSNQHYDAANAPLEFTQDEMRRDGKGKMHNKKLHAGVWLRFIAIFTLFTIIALSISVSTRISTPTPIIGEGKDKPRFVTIVMPRSAHSILSRALLYFRNISHVLRGTHILSCYSVL